MKHWYGSHGFAKWNKRYLMANSTPSENVTRVNHDLNPLNTATHNTRAFNFEQRWHWRTQLADVIDCATLHALQNAFYQGKKIRQRKTAIKSPINRTQYHTRSRSSVFRRNISQYVFCLFHFTNVVEPSRRFWQSKKQHVTWLSIETEIFGTTEMPHWSKRTWFHRTWQGGQFRSITMSNLYR